MKQNNKQIVFYSKEKDGFLASYNDRSTLAFEAKISNDLEDALYIPVDSYERQKDELDKLAEVFDCEVLIVEVKYNVTKLDGTDFERKKYEEVTRDDFEEFWKKLTNQ